jgi:3-oxoacyl-[acyl-carrier-protein] synthase-3
MRAFITAIEYHLPETVVTNSALAAEFPDWSVDKIDEKTGIAQRHVAAAGECASDLGVAAARKLFASGACSPGQIDFLLFCTQSPDFFLPTTACLMQERLDIPTSAGALDFNLGCSGFVYGLGLAKGLIETGQAQTVLLITAETYSKFMHPGDKSVRTIFGDAAAATLIQAVESAEEGIGPLVFGTDGRGGSKLIVPTGGLRRSRTEGTAEPRADEYGNLRSEDNLYMSGPDLFNFTLRVVPETVAKVLSRAGLELDDVGLFVFHQANRYMLEHLRKKLKIPSEKFCVSLRDCGNTVSSTIPIALKDAHAQVTVRPNIPVLLVGFGVGYSWGAALIRWPKLS